MSALTEAQATLDKYETARDAILDGRVSQLSYKSNAATLLPLSEVERQIGIYRRRVATLSGRTGFQRITPRGAT